MSLTEDISDTLLIKFKIGVLFVLVLKNIFLFKENVNI